MSMLTFHFEATYRKLDMPDPTFETDMNASDRVLFRTGFKSVGGGGNMSGQASTVG